MFRTFRKIQGLSSVRDRIKRERQTRLNKGVDAKSLTMKTLDDIHRIRNIGIIAHIDAGKTTTTERMLYYAGALPSPGDIDEGTTAMDYLVQERERGITIRSAAISFNWKEDQINLIDTPGHVDFSGQVTRSLQVLDGVVTIIDAVKGVQSQTQKVWANANKHNLPKICYLNKMDRIGSSVQQSVKSIQTKFGVKPLVLQYPIGDGDSFKGVVDLLQMQQILFKGQYGDLLTYSKIPINTEKHNYYQKLRNKLTQQVSDYDDKVAEMFLADQFVPSALLKQAIRKSMISKQYRTKVVPILVGSSFKNIGVQPLIDAISDFLPSPAYRDPIKCFREQIIERMPNKDQPWTGYVFKVLFDAERGPLAYTRIYSGELHKIKEIYNSTKKHTEKIHHILRVRANQYVQIHSIGTGDIVALSGLTQTSAGDTLTFGSDDFTLPKLDIPTPVFTAPFELESNKHFKQFDEAMRRAVIQDNSLTYKYEKQTNQYLVSGLGQLHLQILKDRLKGEGIAIKMGNLKINFKETVNKSEKQSHQIKNELKPTVFEEFNLTLRITPIKTQEDKIQEKNSVQLYFTRISEFDVAWNQFLRRKSQKNSPHQQASSQNLHKLKKIVRNPTVIQPIYDDTEPEQNTNSPIKEQEESSDEDHATDRNKDEEQPYYHINTLPFQTLYQLVQACQTSILYGKNNLPTTGVEIQIVDGKYKKSSFSKSIMNKCASILTRKLISKTSVLIQPIMEFSLVGDQILLQLALKDVLKRRGTISQQNDSFVTGKIPAQGIKGWVKQIRSMGLQIEIKFDGYEEVSGINPEKLLQNNM